MKAKLHHSGFALLAMVALAGCPKDESESTPIQPPVTPPTTAAPAATPAEATATPTADVVPDLPAGMSLAKTELDGRVPDVGHAGSTLVAQGTKATFVVPTGWTTKAGAWTVATSADGSGRFTAGSYKDGEAPAGKLGDAATALGLTDCSWGTADDIGLGKDKIPASAADGTCKRDGKPVKAIYAALSGAGMNALAVGAWDETSDNKPVLNTFRSAKGAVGGGGDPTGIAACCSALRQNAASAPLNQQGAYLAAAGACQAAISNPQGRAALAGVRALLQGANVPAPCR